MSRLAIPMALLLSAAALASCAGKGQTTATRTVTVQASGAGAPPRTATPPSSGSSTKGQPSKTRVAAFARAVNLRAADVPGFRPTQSESHSTPAEKRLEGTLMRCIGAGEGTSPVLEASSINFERGASIAQQSVNSSVTVARSKSQAIKDLNEFQSAHSRSCFTRYLNLLFKASTFRGATVGPISIAHGTPPAPGMNGSFGLRISVAIVIRAVRIPFYMDILGFVHGSTEVSLLSSGVPSPFPAAVEQHLFLLLLERTKAHSL